MCVIRAARAAGQWTLVLANSANLTNSQTFASKDARLAI